MNISTQINYRRIYLGLSAEELGKRVGVSRATIYRYERYNAKIPFAILCKICEVLEIDVAEIMGIERG